MSTRLSSSSPIAGAWPASSRKCGSAAAAAASRSRTARGDRVATERGEAQRQHLQREGAVGRRLLLADAVLEEQRQRPVLEMRPAGFQPVRRRLVAGQQPCCQHQAHCLGDEVIVRRRIKRGEARQPGAGCRRHRRQPLAGGDVDPWRQCRRHDRQGGEPQAGFDAGIPADTATGRIRLHPCVERAEKRLGQRCITGAACVQRWCGQEMKAVCLGDVFDVAASALEAKIDIERRKLRAGPVASAYRIECPDCAVDAARTIQNRARPVSVEQPQSAGGEGMGGSFELARDVARGRSGSNSLS